MELYLHFPVRLYGVVLSYAQGYIAFTLSTLLRGVKLTTHLHVVPRLKNAWSYTSTPPLPFHGVVLSLKRAQVQLYLLP
jgi:hypothetical protein